VHDRALFDLGPLPARRTREHADHLPNGFVDRTDDLLFVAFRSEAAYFIDIYPHDPQSWTDRDVLRTAVRNWPDANIVLPLRGAVGLAHEPTDDDYRVLRNAGATTMLQIDGAVYTPLGQTTAGPLAWATQSSNVVMRALRKFRDSMSSASGLLEDKLNEGGLDLSHDWSWRPHSLDGMYGVLAFDPNDLEGRLFYPLTAQLQ
jgi:hypothetical protein